MAIDMSAVDKYLEELKAETAKATGSTPQPATWGDALSDLGSGLSTAFGDRLPASLAKAYATITDDEYRVGQKSDVQQYIEQQEREAQQNALTKEQAKQVYPFGMSRGTLRTGVENVGSSLPGMIGVGVGGMIGGAVGGIPGMVKGAATGGLLAGAASGFGSARYDHIMQTIGTLKTLYPDLTEDQAAAMVDQIGPEATTAGLWEAGTEGVGSAFQGALLATPVGGISKTVGAMAPGLKKFAASAMLKAGIDIPVEIAEEMLTELGVSDNQQYSGRPDQPYTMPTGSGQSGVQYRAGLSERLPTYGEAFEELAGPTAVTSALTMGLGEAVSQANKPVENYLRSIPKRIRGVAEETPEMQARQKRADAAAAYMEGQDKTGTEAQAEIKPERPEIQTSEPQQSEQVVTPQESQQTENQAVSEPIMPYDPMRNIEDLITEESMLETAGNEEFQRIEDLAAQSEQQPAVVQTQPAEPKSRRSEFVTVEVGTPDDQQQQSAFAQPELPDLPNVIRPEKELTMQQFLPDVLQRQQQEQQLQQNQTTTKQIEPQGLTQQQSAFALPAPGEIDAEIQGVSDRSVEPAQSTMPVEQQDVIEPDSVETGAETISTAIDISPENLKESEEAQEVAQTNQSRNRVQKAFLGGFGNDQYPVVAARAFDEIRKYESQLPKLESRTSDSILRQAYSTPPTLAQLVQSLAGASPQKQQDRRYIMEPTAGNGALLFQFGDSDVILANEIYEPRAKALRDNKYADTVLARDFHKLNVPEKAFQVVIANPPFGRIKDADGKIMQWELGDGVKAVSEADFGIVAKSLKSMDDYGIGVFVIGSVHPRHYTDETRKAAYNEGSRRRFMYWLYNNYNVAEHFTVSGKLYEKRGAAYPVDVIVVHGSGKSDRPLPSIEPPKVYRTYEELRSLYELRPELFQFADAHRRTYDINLNERPAETAKEFLAGIGREQEGSGIGGGFGEAGSVRVGSGESEVDTEGVPASSGKKVRSSGGRGGSGTRGSGRRGQSGGMGSRSDEAESSIRGDGQRERPGITGDQQNRPVEDSQVSGGSNLRTDGNLPDSRLDDGTTGLTGSDTKRDDDLRGSTEPVVDTAETGQQVGKTENQPESGETRREEDSAISERKAVQRHDGTSDASPVRQTNKAGQTEYLPMSTGNGLNTLIPQNFAKPLETAFRNFLDEHQEGVDAYVANELGFTVPELHKALSAEQIDAVALAINAISKNNGFILGDQTGVGKGRVVASIISWAVRQKQAGKRIVPVFVTEKPLSLYRDMYRDLESLGHGKFRALITDNDFEVELYDGRVLKTNKKQKHEKALLEAADEFLPDHDMVFTTYSGAKANQDKVLARREFLRKLAPDAVLILDEAHNAGGAAKSRGQDRKSKKEDGEKHPPISAFFREILSMANGVLYSSATFSKSPDVMDLYMRTSLGKLFPTASALLDVFDRGGIPYQQVVSAQLVADGQMIRREQSYEGIEFHTDIIPVNTEKQNKQLDEIIAMTREIHATSLREDLLKEIQEAADNAITAAGGRKRKETDSELGEQSLDSVNFTAIMHNLVNTVMMALKVDSVVDAVKREIKKGNKVTIAIDNTNEAHLVDTGRRKGDDFSNDFAKVFTRYIEKWKRVQYNDRNGKAATLILEDEDIPLTAAVIKELKQLFAGNKSVKDLPESPIDMLLYKLKQAGITADEITGRSIRLDYETNTVQERTKQPTTKLIDGFNSGETDVMLLNPAGSTGISLHASKTFKDQRKRVMIIWQAPKEINTFMQMLGRIHRTGTVENAKPEYFNIILDLPSETRYAMVLQKKLASLNANTTASNESKVKGASYDMMNRYGDEIAADILRERPNWNTQLGNPAGLGDDAKKKDAGKDVLRKATGRILLLPREDGKRFLDEVTEAYGEMLEVAEKTGKDLGLELKRYDIKAKPVKTVVLRPRDRSLPGEFGAEIKLGIFSGKNLVIPFSREKAEAQQQSQADYLEVKKSEMRAATKEVDALFADVSKAPDEAERKKADKVFKHTRKSLLEIRSFLDNIEPGQARLFYGDPFFILSIKLANKGNPLLASNWKIKGIFAGSPKVTQVSAFSMLDSNYVSDITPEYFWDKHLMFAGSQRPYMIITGNIARAFGKENGRLVAFTKADGTTEQGILVPDKAVEKKLEISRQSEIVFEWEQKDLKKLADAMEKGENEVTTVFFKDEDGSRMSIDVRHQQEYGVARKTITLSTPRPKSTGGRFYLNDEILKLIRSVTHSEHPGFFSDTSIVYPDTGRTKTMAISLKTNHFRNSGVTMAEFLAEILRLGRGLSDSNPMIYGKKAVELVKANMLPKNYRSEQDAWTEIIPEYQAIIDEGRAQTMAGTTQNDVDAAAFGELMENSKVESSFEMQERMPEPKRTVKGYKLFRIDKDHPNKLFPLFIDANTAVPIGEWIPAQMGEGYAFQADNGHWYIPSTAYTVIDQKTGKRKTTKTGSPILIPNEEVRNELVSRGYLPENSKATKITALARRPGWHLGNEPASAIIGVQSGEIGKLDTRPPYQVWAEVEVPDDVDWQTEADNRAEITKSGTKNMATAHITNEVPVGGFYRYKTNPTMKGKWIIAGAIKVNRVLTDEEVRLINKDTGFQDFPRRVPRYDNDWQWNNKKESTSTQKQPKPNTISYLDLLKKVKAFAPYGVKVVVVPTYDGNKITEQTNAFYSPANKTVVLIADRIGIDEVDGIILEEFIHNGLDVIRNQEELDPALRKPVDELNGLLDRAWRDRREDILAFTDQYTKKYDQRTTEGQRKLAEEWIARKGPRLARSWWRRLVEAIRNIIAKIPAFKRFAKWSDADTVAIVEEALSRSTTVKNRRGIGTIVFDTAISEAANQAGEIMANDDGDVDTSVKILPETHAAVQSRQERAERAAEYMKLPESERKVKPVVLPDDVQQEFSAARGESKKSLRQLALDSIEKIKRDFTRHFTELDTRNPATKMGDVADILRIQENVPNNSFRLAVNAVTEIVKPMTTNEYQLFADYMILADLQNDVEMGIYDMRESDLPFGFESFDQVKTAFNSAESAVRSNPVIDWAVTRRKDFMDALRRTLVRERILPKTVLDRQDYFHHMRLSKINESSQIQTGTGRDLRDKKKGWQFARKGRLANYNTQYIEAEVKVIAEGLAKIETKRNLQAILKIADIKKNLVQEVAAMNLELANQVIAADQLTGGSVFGEETVSKYTGLIAWALSEIKKDVLDGSLEIPQEMFGGLYGAILNEKMTGAKIRNEQMMAFVSWLINHDTPSSKWAAMIFKNIKRRNDLIRKACGSAFRTWQSMVPDSHAIWKPEPGQAFYFTNSITDQAVERLLDGVDEFTESSTRKVLARGRDVEVVIPKELATTLNNFKAMTDQTELENVVRKIHTGWKQYVLLNPMRAMKYNINNFSGDLDIVIAYNPKILRYAYQAAKDLASGKTMEDIELAYRLRVLQSGWSSIEVSDITDSFAEFRQFRELMVGHPEGLIGKAVQLAKDSPARYWAWIKDINEWREGVLRLAAFRFFRDEIRKGNQVYGVSVRKEIDQITDPDRQAAKLAVELLGDYGNLSKGSRYIRDRLIPFYSWMEINTPRYVRLLKNAPFEIGSDGKQKQIGTTIPRVTGVFGKKAGVSAVMAGGYALGLAALLMAVVQAWNRLVMGDLDDELEDWQRQQMHIILGRNPDGSVMTMRFQGAFSDALSWFGLENPMRTAEYLAKGEIKPSEVGKTMATSGIKKIITGLGPEYKVGFELATGESMYPDPFNRLPIRDRVDYLGRFLSLPAGIRAIATGQPIKNGSWQDQFVDDLLSLVTYSADPGQQAYHQTRGLAAKWIAEVLPDKVAWTGTKPTDKANALYYYKKSLQLGDLEAAENFLKRYYELGGKPTTVASSIRKSHPLNAITSSKLNPGAFRQTLSDSQLRTVERGIKWYQRTYLESKKEQ